MNIAYQRNIGAFIAAVTSVLPQSANAAVNGVTIDRVAHKLPLSCVLHTVVGALSGAPTTTSVVSKLQHSPDGSTWTDYIQPGETSVASTAAVTAANTEASKAIELSSAYRYIRSVTTPTFTGGTSPAALLAADIVLGGEMGAPAA